MSREASCRGKSALTLFSVPNSFSVSEISLRTPNEISDPGQEHSRRRRQSLMKMAMFRRGVNRSPSPLITNGTLDFPVQQGSQSGKRTKGLSESSFTDPNSAFHRSRNSQ